MDKLISRANELLWFNDKDIIDTFNIKEESIYLPTRAQTKVIASIKKNYSSSFLDDLINSGIRLFRINGAYFQHNEYKKLISELNEKMEICNDKASYLFDLKGPIPRISKIGQNIDSINVKKNQLIKLIHENNKVNENDVIHVDRKFIEFLKLGDRIVIDSSNTILKVIAIERYKKKKFGSYTQTKDTLSEDYESLFDQELDDIPNYFSDLPIIEEKNENETFLLVDDNLDSNIEDRMKQRQQKMNQAYLSIINKHRGYIEYNKINDLRYISEGVNSSFDSLDEDNLIYKIKRHKIKSTAASQKRGDNMIICEVQHEGTIRLYKKLFLLDKEIIAEIGGSPIVVKDLIDINKVIDLGIYVITALVNNAEDICEIKEILGENVGKAKIFARIETSEAIYKFDSILEKSDGIIINYGLISSKIPYEEICLIETYMFEKCKILQKPIFLQTNILKSMTSRIKPSVSEISNLDYIVNNGIDGLILKEEVTNSNNYNDLIKLLKDVLVQIEAFSETKQKYEELSKFYKIHNEYIINSKIESLLDSAVKTAYEVNVGLIILFSDNYKFAKGLSKYRPNCRIICVTDNETIFNYLRFVRGVSPFLYENILEDKIRDYLTINIIQKAKNKSLLLTNTIVLIINAFIGTDNEEIHKNGIYFYESNYS